jgi:Flp pilus assembly protein TadG
MKDLEKNKGQALIETALVLMLLLIILFGIAEFSRAWYVRNSLKNAVRSGARLAVVTCGVSNVSNVACPASCPAPATTPADCNDTGSSANNSAIIGTVCCSLGDQTRNVTTVTIATTAHDPSGLTADDIKVSGSTTFTFVLGGGIWPWAKSTTITTDATMRHE